MWLSVVLGLTHSIARAAPLVLDAKLPAEIRGCVSLEQLQAAYQRALAAHGGETAAASTLHVKVSSTPGDAPGTLRLEVKAASSRDIPKREPGAREPVARETGARELGTRELQVQASDCHALADAIGLVLALLARDSPASDAAPPEPEPEPETKTETAPAPHPQPGEHLALAAGAGAMFGVLPSAAFALQLQAATTGEPLSLRIRAGMLLPREKRLAEGVIEARSYELALDMCTGLRLPSWPRLALRACAGPRLGLIYARGRDFLVHNQSQREFVVYIGLLPEAAVRLGGSTWLQLDAGGALALIRPHFEVERTAGMPILALKTPGVLRAELSLSLVQIF